MTRSAIPTTHRGANFRSRLEARWAAFFDLVGWRWIYEPIDADGYIPDFLIEGPAPFFVEVGQCIDRADFVAKSGKADRNAAILGRDLLILGVSALPRLPLCSGILAAGLLGEYAEWPSQDGSGVLDAGFSWDTAVWTGLQHIEGDKFGQLGVYHTSQSYQARTGAGNTWFGEDRRTRFPEEIDALWIEAGNRVQWKKS